MNRSFLAFITLLWLTVAIVQAGSPSATTKPTQTSVLKGRNGRHWFTLHLAKGPFRKERHKIKGSGNWPQIDGKYELRGFRRDKDGTVHSDGGKNWYGTDAGLPRMEFYQFDLVVDGKRWKIPSHLYCDCYHPNIHIKPQPFVWAWLSKDGRRLTVKMRGSDGAGAYKVIWYLRRDGRHSRKLLNPEDDE
jgi:hypothetical protein